MDSKSSSNQDVLVIWDNANNPMKATTILTVFKVVSSKKTTITHPWRGCERASTSKVFILQRHRHVLWSICEQASTSEILILQRYRHVLWSICEWDQLQNYSFSRDNDDTSHEGFANKPQLQKLWSQNACILLNSVPHSLNCFDKLASLDQRTINREVQ